MTDYLENTKCAPARLGAVLVLGLGVSGKAVARYCAALVGSRVELLAQLRDMAAHNAELAVNLAHK